MIKLKHTLVLSFLVLGTALTFGQNYVNVYDAANDEVRMRMDDNKILGVDILNDVVSTHVIGIMGLSSANSAELESALSNNDKVYSFKTGSDYKSIEIVSYAGIYKNDFKTLLAQFNIVMTGYNVTYSIKNNK